MDTLKKMEKEHLIGEDEQHDRAADVQQLTDDMIAKIDEALATKEEEIMQV